ncbi:hypothetical protein V6N11_036998 [Hibiscus sabdariffa]|uniref:Uncharacterized protein n=1 Tax=Hibiscus sabdariffa TaxID=183260 RepID=A0ABR2RCH5_9ROSI
MGVSDALTCIGGGRRGLCSADDVKFAGAGDQSRVVVEAMSTPESVDNRESHLGLLDCVAASSKTTVVVIANNDLSSSPVVLGVTGAALAPVLGSIPGGVRKVKSVNYLVEALALPEQRRSIAVARARRGCGRPAKTCVLIKVDIDVANASLTDSDIQESKLETVTLEVVSRLWITFCG